MTDSSFSLNATTAFERQQEAEFVSTLRSHFGPQQCLTGKDIDAVYLTDFVGTLRGKASALVFARSTEDVSFALKTAYHCNQPVTVRGAGTNLVGSTVPAGGLVLDLSQMNHILSLDKETNTLETEPGVRLKDLQSYVESEHLFYPPDPADKEASICGNIATNAGGMRAVKYGVTRDYVRALEFVKPDGTVLTLGANTCKYSSGLNLKELVVGSEGTLGVITRAWLKVIALPETSVSVVVPYSSLQQALVSVRVLLNAGLNPAAVEFVEKNVIALGERFLDKEFPFPEATAYLLLTFDGSQQSVEHALQEGRRVLLENGALDFLALTDPEVRANVWAIRAALAKSVKASGVWEPVDTVVPVNRIADFVQYVNELSQELSVRIVAFGHAGDGNVHLCIIKDQIPDDKWPQVLDLTLDKLYAKAYALGGLTSAEHGIGKAKRKYFLANTDPAVVELMRAVKQAFDPKGLFNVHDGYAR